MKINIINYINYIAVQKSYLCVILNNLYTLFLFTDPLPYAYEDLVELFNNFRSNIVLLQDLKTALNTAEEELNNLNVKMKEEKGVVRLFIQINFLILIAYCLLFFDC